ncbi:type II toxin-antitoxin system death-on-curing family toxin [Nocardioides nematodiphilus]|uniref:type II toxin-antitoxin system death-on-curing family toxin n=1 Tax=Nocardioides nematodiphilus TaxID=2849669 RepID=UPI001CD98075|nr:type II toxin-antitoxin system death-on-curing family toxin [Nocardioides nematodiphilus]MCA1982958.1 type II toxin-antitoxin system death-on-curing family toxin [Nocardioides nematodiphilus]
MSRSARVADLAQEAGLDLDETLVALWDAGLDDLDGASSVVPDRALPVARRALGLALAKQLASPSYWKGLLGLDDQDWADLMVRLQIDVSDRARTLPKGAPAKLKQYARASASPLVTNRARPAKPPEMTPVVWKTIGRARELDYLSAVELDAVHGVLIEEFAGTEDPFGDPCGVREWDLLESSAFRPQTTFGEVRKYESVEMAGAALLHSVIHNHPFHNGNKRTALVAMLVFLDRHDLLLTCHEDDLFRFVLRVAQHGLVPAGSSEMADREALLIAAWIKANSRRVQRGEQPMKWLQLRRLLANYDCVIEPAPGVGNRINITRVVSGRGLLGIPKRRSLRTQVAYRDDGREADRSTVHKIRADLRLDEDHGIDSAAFYSDQPTARDFVHEHQKTLTRLAKL